MARFAIFRRLINIGSTLAERAFAPQITETEVLPNGETQTYQVAGFLRSRTVLTLIATGLISTFGWAIESSVLVEILFQLVTLGGLFLAGEFRRRAQVVLK